MFLRATAVGLTAFTASNAALAQEATPASSDIVVTGFKNVESAGQVSATANAGLLGDRDQFETPFSQASYTTKLIQDQQARTLDEVLDNNSSIRDTANSYSDAEQLNIRGFPSQPQSVLFDGVPGLIGSRRVAIEGVERVDVLLGPSALLYNGLGDQNVGGVVNLQPKRAGDTALTRLLGSYVSSSSFEVQGDVGRRFGADDTFGVRANVAGLAGDTPLDHQNQRMALGTLALDARTDRLHVGIDLLANHYRLSGNRPSLRPLAGAPIPKAPDASSNVFDRSSTYNERNFLGLVRADYKPTNWLTIDAAYGHARFTERYRGPYYSRLTSASGDVDVNVIPYATNTDVDVGQVSARAVFDTGPLHHEMTISGDLYRYGYGNSVQFLQQLSTNLYNPVPFAPRITDNPKPDGDFGDNSRSRRNSVAFADVVTAFDGRLTLIGGVRRQSIDDREIDQDTGETTDRFRQSAYTPAGAVMFKITPRFSVYGNYIQALQSGPTAPGLTVNQGQVFPPFRAEQYEAGVKWDLRVLGLTAAVFQITQPSSYINANNVFVVNGEARNRGVELNAFGSIRHGLRLLSGVTYFDPVQVRTGDLSTEGKLAVGIPHWQANLGGEWDVAAVPGLTLTTRVIYTSREYVDALNTQSIPNWTRWDLGARYGATIGGRPVTLRFDVRNLTGHDYWQDASQGLLYEGAPRTFRLSISTDL